MDINIPYSIVVLSGEYLGCEEDGTSLLQFSLYCQQSFYIKIDINENMTYLFENLV